MDPEIQDRRGVSWNETESEEALGRETVHQPLEKPTFPSPNIKQAQYLN